MQKFLETKLISLIQLFKKNVRMIDFTYTLKQAQSRLQKSVIDYEYDYFQFPRKYYNYVPYVTNTLIYDFDYKFLDFGLRLYLD